MTGLRRQFAALAVSSICSGALLCVSPLHAQSSSSATAELLFQQGKELLEQGNVVEACPKFAESYRLDPALGTLLGLALCHEREGKLASAWAEFSDAQGQAKREGRADREQLAMEKAEALRPRLSMLTVEVPPDVAATPGLEILRDGEVLGSATWNLAVPVDGGTHVIEARAPGMVPVKLEVSVPNESAGESVRVPALVAAPKEEVAPPPPPPPEPDKAPSAPPAPPADDGFTTLQWVGIGTGSLGVVSLGVGAIFVSSMLDQHEASQADCDGDVCGDTGFAARTAAREDGDTATILGVAGAVLLGAGTTLYFVGDADAPPQTGSTRLDVTATSNGGALQLTTAF